MARSASASRIIPRLAKGRREGAAEVLKLPLADGRTMGVRRWVGPERGTIVLLHGLLDSSAGWTHVCERLPGHRVAFDLAGFGESDPPDRGSIAGYTDDVEEGLSRLGITHFTLVGHSLGGAVAATLAERMPGRVDALILLAPAGFGRIRLAEAISVPIVRTIAQAAMPMALSSRMMVTAGYMAMVANRRSPEQEVVQRVLECGSRLVEGAREGTRAVVVASRGERALHRQTLRYAGPVFAVWGDHDRLVPVSHRHAVRRAYVRADVDVWAGMGHHPQHERPDELLALVQRALAARAVAAGRGSRAVRAA
jgi:pimeloyl-ACP methyl ester carboxylesterase